MKILMNIVLGIVFASCFAHVPAAASNPTDIAFRLQMVAMQMQTLARMQKSVCLLLKGADSTLQAGAARAAATAFEAGLESLLMADDDQNTASGTIADTRVILFRLSTKTPAVTVSTRQIVAGDLHAVPMLLMLSGARDLQENLDFLADHYVGALSDDLSSRQMVRTQQIARMQVVQMQALLRAHVSFKLAC